jgi:glutathione S-transferase
MKRIGKPDEEAVAKHTAALENTLKVYDGILAKQAYLAGDELTLADLFHLPYAMMNKASGLAGLYDKFPHVSKWLNELSTRESWVKITETYRN